MRLGSSRLGIPTRLLPVTARSQLIPTITVPVPGQPGKYQLVAELSREGAPPVRSLRDFRVVSERQRRERMGLAVGKTVTASSTATRESVTYRAGGAVDGNPRTRWSSEFSDPQWIAVDLGGETKISRVKLLWEGAYGKAYRIEVSADGKAWKEVHKTDKGNGGTDEIRFAPTSARWVRMSGTKRGTQFGYSLWEFQVFP